MRKNIVAGNWKMNKTLQEGIALAKEIKASLSGKTPKCEVIVGTPFIHLASVCEELKDSVIAVAAENCADKPSGAYTGEVSAAMVASTGAFSAPSVRKDGIFPIPLAGRPISG